MPFATPYCIKEIWDALYVYVYKSGSTPGLIVGNVPVERRGDPSSPAHPCAASSGLQFDRSAHNRATTFSIRSCPTLV